MKTILILGATGAVGRELLALALQHPDISQVVAPTRRALTPHAKLVNPSIDFENLPATASWWRADITCCALGTTRKQAGSAAAFYRVDHDYIVQAAELTKAAGTPVFVLNSTLGAAANRSGLYLKTKGQTERDVQALGFASLTLVRPSLLAGAHRPDKRYAEALGLWINRWFGPLIPARWRAVAVRKVAQAMLSAGLAASAGCRVIESADIQRIS
jgi:uncharacterized protein YbjT (DUF2867 family)